MSGLKWCSWCCNCRPRQCFCCKCCLCKNCCRCPPPILPGICPMPELPCMPTLEPPPPPIRVVKEHVILPVAVPVPCIPKCVPTCVPTCGGGDTSCRPYCFWPPACCYEPDPEVQIYHPCPPAFPKRSKFTDEVLINADYLLISTHVVGVCHVFEMVVSVFRIFKPGCHILPGYRVQKTTNFIAYGNINLYILQ